MNKAELKDHRTEPFCVDITKKKIPPNPVPENLKCNFFFPKHVKYARSGLEQTLEAAGNLYVRTNLYPITVTVLIITLINLSMKQS